MNLSYISQITNGGILILKDTQSTEPEELIEELKGKIKMSCQMP
jgi:hypothetical protein